MYKNRLATIILLLVLIIFFCFAESINASADHPKIKTGDWWTYSVYVGEYEIEGYMEIKSVETLNIDGTLIETWNVSIENPFYSKYDYYSTDNFSLVKEKQIVEKGAEDIFPGSNYCFTLLNPFSFWPLELGKNLSYKTRIEIIPENFTEPFYSDVTITYNCSQDLVEKNMVGNETKKFDCYEFVHFYKDKLFFEGNKIYLYYSPELDWFVEYKVEYPNGELFYKVVLKDYEGNKENNTGDIDDEKKENNYFTFVLIGILILLAIFLSIIGASYYKSRGRNKDEK